MHCRSPRLHDLPLHRCGRELLRLDGLPRDLRRRNGHRLPLGHHTEVPDVYRGQGVGLAMVEYAVEMARESDRSILPLCPFAAAQFRRHPEWSDVLNRSASKGEAG